MLYEPCTPRRIKRQEALDGVERVARVYCDPSELAAVCKRLQESGWAPGLVQFAFVPKVRGEGGGGARQRACVCFKERKTVYGISSLVCFSRSVSTHHVQTYVDVEEAKDGEGPQLLALLEALDEDPDVQNVFHNARLA